MVYFSAENKDHMSLIIAKNLSKSFGSEDIFEDVSLTVPPKGRIGIVGANGCGKSTLLQILIGQQSPDHGTVQRSRSLRIGYLPQHISVPLDGSAYELALGVFGDLIALQAKLHAIEADLSKDAANEDLLVLYGKLMTQFEEAGGFTMDSRIRQVLQGLGFSDGEENRPWAQLSGGQKTRAYLARLLLMNPDLLVLDEPTNHLDIASVEFLENYLQGFDGAVLIVSHDRYFLDQVAETILELTDSVELYHGNYSAYLSQRDERYERRIKEYEAQQEFIAKEEEYIRRNIEGQNTRQAQGRRKRLERLMRDSALIRPQMTEGIKLRMKTDLRSGDIVLRTKNVKVGYPDDRVVLINLPDITLLRGECAAIIGPNGTGKSTLIKTILGQLKPLDGEVLLGSNLKIGYFAQAHELLHPDYTVYDEIAESMPSFTPGEIRSFAARFLFTGDDVYKKISSLSGGERGRLAIALLSLQKANLLLLDEPMNHLDIQSQETLQAILKTFEGTILLISHDRYIVNAMATQLWLVQPDTRTLDVFSGTYQEYTEFRKNERAERMKSEPAARAIRISAESQDEQLNSANRKPVRSNNEQLRLEKKAKALEEKITELEKELTRVGNEMNRPDLDFTEITELSGRYNNLEAELNAAMEEWSSLDL